ncbi:MAG: hypothetical protein H6658_00280 [Ardenticatenaceae bacterium]|nr:hypothetical protein [Ardenticatenaceae bacterium]
MPPKSPAPSSRREWLIALLIALLTIAITLIPYGLASLPHEDGRLFTHTIMNPEDSQTYFAKIYQGYQGHALYTIPFTPEPHNGAFVGVFYVWLGHLARVTGLSITAVWHTSRLLADLILFLTTFAFISQFLTDRFQRWTAYLLALFGSGLGWLLFVIGQPYWLGHFPVDFKQPGAHLFFTAFTYPHITLGTACILISIWGLWRLGDGQTTLFPLLLLLNLSNTALGIAYPFLLYIIMVVTALYWLYLTLRARRFLWQKGFLFASTYLIPAPLYIYYAYTLQTNAVFKAWDVQAATPSPPWPHFIVAYGLMLLLGLLYWYKKPEQRPLTAILWLWILAVALLLYAPLGPQRRFVQGVHVPLAILATAAFTQLFLPRWQQSKLWQHLLTKPRYNQPGLTRLTTLIFLAFMSFSNLYVLASVSTSSLIQRPDPLFRPADELEAANWLAQNGEETAVLIGDMQTGNYIAAHTPVRVILGHWAETVDYETKQALVSQFYSTTTSHTWRQDLIQQYHIRYIWYGPREQQLGDFDPQTAVYLQPLYANPTITIYTVKLTP